MSDDRKGKPSASGALKYSRCPASWRWECALPKPDAGPDALFGTKCHARMAGTLPDEEVTPEIEECCRLLTHYEQEVWLTVLKECDLPETVEARIVREQRLWWVNETMSGQPDVVYLFQGRALVIDYKTGRGEVDAANVNMQMRWLAALVSLCYEVNEVFVAVVQPYVTPPFTIARYGVDDLFRASKEVNEALRNIALPDAPEVPGPWCRYCPALGLHCTATRELPAVQSTRQLPASGEDIARWLEAAQRAEDAIRSGREQARAIIAANPDSVPGWRIGKPRHVRKIVEPLRAWQASAVRGMDQQAFLDSVTVSVTKFESNLGRSLGIKGKELKATTDEILEGNVEITETRGSLEKVSE